MKKMISILAPEGAGAGGGTGTGDPKTSTGGSAGTGQGGTGTGNANTGTGSGSGTSITGEGAASGQGTGGEAKAQETSGDLKLKLPEGVDGKAAEPFVAIFKKHGLKQEVAQEIFDYTFKAVTETTETVGKTTRETVQREIAEKAANDAKAALDQARADKEIGGAMFAANVALADKAVMRFGGQALMDLLVSTHLGKQAAVIKAFAAAGKLISEDSIGGTTGGTKAGGALSEKAKLKAEFPNSPGMWEHLPD